MKLVFNLLDASYEVRGGKPQVILWGVAEDGRRVVVIDEGFRPYFYVLPESEDLIPAISQRLRMLSKPKSPIVGLDAVEHKYFGRRVKVIRVTTVIPEYVRTYREEAAKIPGVREVLEADIRFVMRYMIDNNIRPFAWHEVEVEEAEEKGYRVGAVYRALERPRLVDREGIPQLRVLAFDIEVYAPTGSPKHGRDPVIIISTMNSEGEVRQFVAEDMDDREVIKGFVEYVKSYDPDIIVGYNSNKFDWPYLKDRAKVLGIKLDLSRRVGVEPTTSVYGHISVAGRLNVDLYDYAEEIPEIKVKTLENVAEYLGVMKKEERVEIPWYEIPKYWENPELRDKLLQYAQDDVVATYGIAEKILPFAIQLAYITGLPLDQVGAASVGFRLEWYLMREAYRLGELVPNRVERPPLTYKGAIVLEPRKGVHEDIAVLDFSSMYPNIMIRYNVGPDTLLRRGEEEPPEGVWIAPEVGHRFRKAPPGFFKTVLETLLELRKRLREQMKKYEPGTPEYRLLDNRQKAVKVLANAAYGYQGWTVARWYCRECAEAVTAWGRQTIMGALKIAGELGLEVIYGDTDSLFVRHEPGKVKKFIELVEERLGFDIKIDKVYRRVFFTEAKKRYIGLLEDGRIDIVGFEAVRGDWAEIAKEVQEKVAEIVLREGDVEKAIEYVKSLIEELKAGKVPLEKLVIWKTLTKSIKEYSVEAPHVAAAKRMKEKGYTVEVGDKVGYVIVKGGGTLSSRAYPYFLAKPSDIDSNYYVDHQVIPAALRILGYYGVTEARLKALSRGQKSLFDFF